MASVSSAQAARALLLLLDAAKERQAELQEFAPESDAIDTHDEVESESLIFLPTLQEWGIRDANNARREEMESWALIDLAWSMRERNEVFRIMAFTPNIDGQEMREEDMHPKRNYFRNFRNGHLSKMKISMEQLNMSGAHRRQLENQIIRKQETA